MSTFKPGGPQPAAATAPWGFYDLTTHLLAIEVEKLGFEPDWIRRDLFVVDVEGLPFPFWGTQTPATIHVSARAAKDKGVARALLSRAKVPVADGAHFQAGQLGAASHFAASLGSPVVVKPAGGRKGRGVALDLYPGPEFDRAFEEASKDARGVIVERQFIGGDEIRLFVANGRCRAAYRKRPPQVIGDGQSSIDELVRSRNKKRRDNPHLRTRPLRMTDARLDRLRSNGYGIEDVLPLNQVLLIDSNANVSAGGESVDATEEIHPSYFDVAIAASRALHRLEPAGVDLLATDMRSPAAVGNHVVLEVNSSPALGAHHFPLVGRSRNVASDVVLASLSDGRAAAT